MHIRPVIKSDFPQIIAIWKPVIETSIATFNSVVPTIDMLTDMLRTKNGFFVALNGDTVLGFALYGQFRGGIGYCQTMEHTIILAPNAWGKGIGRKLMDAVETDARTNGAHSMFAGVCAENTSGVLFHKACGYIEVATLSQVGRKFDRWLDLVLLQKIF